MIEVNEHAYNGGPCLNSYSQVANVIMAEAWRQRNQGSIATAFRRALGPVLPLIKQVGELLSALKAAG
jgi:hypothetical protein